MGSIRIASVLAARPAVLARAPPGIPHSSRINRRSTNAAGVEAGDGSASQRRALLLLDKAVVKTLFATSRRAYITGKAKDSF